MPLTEKQKEIQRKRKISQAVTEKQTEKGRKIREGKDKLELAKSRSKKPEEQTAVDGRITTTGDIAKEEASQANIERRTSEGLPTTLEGEKQLFEQAGVLKELPTEPNQLVEPISTPEGRQQFLDAQREESFAAKLEDKLEGRISKETKDFGGLQLQAIRARNQVAVKALAAAEGPILLGRLVGDIAGDIPFVGGLISGILGDRKEIVREVKSSLEAKNQMSADAARDVTDGTLSVQDGFKVLDAIERQTDEAESLIQQEAILSPAVRRSNELIDIQTDILELRQEIQRGRRDIAGSVISETNPAVVALRLEELRR